MLSRRLSGHVGLAGLVRALIVSFVVACCVMSPPVPAQTPGEVATQEALRQQARERSLREQFQRTPDVRWSPEISAEALLLPTHETPCFMIREIVLEGDDGAFRWALAAAERPGDEASGKCLGGQGIKLVMTRIQNAIIEKGFVTTRVLAEPQDLNGGKLALILIPGRIRVVRFADDTVSRASAWNAFPAMPGDLLNIRDIEQALENFKRVPTAEADIQIAPGMAVGESDVIISWKQSFPLRFNVSANDGGQPSTGKYLGSATISGDHLLTLNDLFYVSLNRDLGGGSPGARGTQGHTVSYSLPFGYWTLSASANANRYHQEVPGDNQAYLYQGTSENYDFKLSRVVYRDAVSKSSVSLRGYLTKSNNAIDDTELQIQRRRMAGWEAGLAHRHFVGQATVDLKLAWRRGTGAFSALPAPEEASNEGTSRPALITVDNALSVPFSLAAQAFRYNLQWRGQWNRTPLIPQDGFSLGGRYTVRGFDGQNILLADRGWLIRNDLALTFREGHELYLGIDHGEVSGRMAELLIGRRLTGVVLGLRGAYKDLSWDLFAGQPLRKPEGFKTVATTTGFNLSLSF